MLNEKPVKYILELTENQAHVISNACELLARVQMGQVHSIAPYIPEEVLSRKLKIRDTIDLNDMLWKSEMRTLSESSSSHVPWDIYKIVRHRLAWDNHPEGGIYVQFDEPLRRGTEPLAKITKVEI